MSSLLNKLKMRLPALGALAATMLFWGFFDRYEPAGPPLLEAPAMADAFRISGDVTESNGVFRLHVPKGGKSADIRFHVNDAVSYSTLRLTGRIRTEAVVKGKHSWTSARLLLIQRRAEGSWVAARHHLHSKSGTVDWTPEVREFEMLPEIAEVELVLQQIGASGTAWYDSINVVPVQLKAAYPWARAGFALLWIFIGALYFRRCRLNRRRLRLLILLNVFAILCGTLMPAHWISEAAGRAKVLVTRVLQQLQDRREVQAQRAQPEAKPAEKQAEKPAEKAAVKKAHKLRYEETQIGHFDQLVGGTHRVGHFVLFALLCFLVYCSAASEGQTPVYYLKVAFDLLLFAAVSESLQFLTLDRSPGVLDWLTDVYGMAAALVLFLIIRLFRAAF